MIKITDIHKEDAWHVMKEVLKTKSYIQFNDHTNSLTQPGYKCGLLVAANPKDNKFMFAVKLKEEK